MSNLLIIFGIIAAAILGVITDWVIKPFLPKKPTFRHLVAGFIVLISLSLFVAYPNIINNTSSNIIPSQTSISDFPEKSVVYFIPSDDTYIRGGQYQTQDFSSESWMSLKWENNPETSRVVYLQFDISEWKSRTIQSATLTLVNAFDPTTGDKVPVDCYGLINDEWDEKSINWENAPAHDTTGLILEEFTIYIGTVIIQSSEEGKVLEWDITSFVNDQISKDGIVSFILSTSKPSESVVGFISKESGGADTPTLIIEFK